MNSWDEVFLSCAIVISRKSKDPSCKVGAVLVDDKNRVISMGYNGFARNVDDSPSKYETREEKYYRIIHAEENAILFSTRQGHKLYVSAPPCSSCMAKIIQVGIKEVVYVRPENPEFYQRWAQSNKVALEMANEANVVLREVERLDVQISSNNKEGC